METPNLCIYVWGKVNEDEFIGFEAKLQLPAASEELIMNSTQNFDDSDIDHNQHLNFSEYKHLFDDDGDESNLMQVASGRRFRGSKSGSMSAESRLDAVREENKKLRRSLEMMQQVKKQSGRRSSQQPSMYNQLSAARQENEMLRRQLLMAEADPNA